MGVITEQVRLTRRVRVALVATVSAVLWSLGFVPSATVATAESTTYVFIYRFSQSSQRWLLGSALPSFAHASVSVGTTFSYKADNPVGARDLEANFDFWRIATGRRVGHNCVAPTTANRGRPRCERHLARGRLSHSAHEGRNTLRFDGRMTRTTWLAPGQYQVELFLSSELGNSASEFLRFTILPPTRGNG